MSNPVTIGSKRSEESSLKEAKSDGIHRNNSLSPHDVHPIEGQTDGE
jgi:hypothetical protein